MRIYQVGGAVRDEMLGLHVKDRDFVVVGAAPEEMERLGFRPVGKDFPVFLHPRTHEEYALARTERKAGRGYKGFTVLATPDVTLEQDLARRDLTINAMARDEEGHLIDPSGGAADLRAGILRHVGPAFVEDPVRILRVARFAARYGFAVAPETMQLMREMVSSGEVDYLVPERVWQEVSRGLMERAPSRMVDVLVQTGALARLLPECPDGGGRTGRDAVDRSAARSAALPERFSAWLAGSADVARAERIADRLRATSECRDLLVLAARLLAPVVSSTRDDPGHLVGVLRDADALRRPARFEQLLNVCADIEAARGARPPDSWRVPLRTAHSAAADVDAAAVAASAGGKGIAEALFAARVEAVRRALAARPSI